MSYRLLESLNRQVLTDLGRSSAMAALAPPTDLKQKQDELPKSAQPLKGEDMDARLRGIRQYIAPKELAALLRCHVGTIYRRVKAGMPADRDVDAQGRGNRIKIYPPRVADWQRDCRKAQERLKQLPPTLLAGNPEGSEAPRAVAGRK